MDKWLFFSLIFIRERVWNLNTWHAVNYNISTGYRKYTIAVQVFAVNYNNHYNHLRHAI
jgi:hypothetical protein